jgi:hypothetical protein
MRLILASIVLAAVAGAQNPDPASLIPADTPIFVECADAGALARLRRRALLVSPWPCPRAR